LDDECVLGGSAEGDDLRDPAAPLNVRVVGRIAQPLERSRHCQDAAKRGSAADRRGREPRLMRSGSKLILQLDNPFKEAFKDFFEQAEAAVTRKEDAILIALNEKILANTPVWEGDTILNWRWSTRAPNYRARGAARPGHRPWSDQHHAAGLRAPAQDQRSASPPISGRGR
jgi:hypothetical protein